MPWFYCDDCGDSIKKPKIAVHCRQCSASSFTCLDCSRVFDQTSVLCHTACVTEKMKYAEGATKPGGVAEKGFYGESNNADDSMAMAGPQSVDAEFLSTKPPWHCKICKVTCTSYETLLGHSSGAKHKRRVKAATASRVMPEYVVSTTAPQELNTSLQVSKPSKTKWKQIALKQLERKGGRMRYNKLEAAVTAEAGLMPKNSLLYKLGKSKKFIIDGKYIRLS